MPQSRAEDPPQPPSAPIPAPGPAPPYYRWPQYQNSPIPAYNPALDYPMARFDPAVAKKVEDMTKKENKENKCELSARLAALDARVLGGEI